VISRDDGKVPLPDITQLYVSKAPVLPNWKPGVGPLRSRRFRRVGAGM